MRARVAVLSLLLLVLCAMAETPRSAPPTPLDYVVKVMEMTGTPMPLEVVVEVVTYKQLESRFMSDYRLRTRNPRARADNYRVFVYGMLDADAAARHKLHMYVIDQTEQTIVHEALHYVLFHSTRPAGIVNDHAVLEPYMIALMTSVEYRQWRRTHPTPEGA